MVILCGKKIRVDYSLLYSLTQIFGIGFNQSLSICNSLGLSKNVTFSFLSLKKKKKLQRILNNMLVGTPRFHEKLDNIKFIKSNNSYRGWRHSKRLPVRGQRTKTNRKTRKKGIF